MSVQHVVVEEHQLEHGCLTLEELRWILRRCKPGSAYFTFFMLRSIGGGRAGEMLKMRLAQFRDNYWSYTYRVEKPKNCTDRHGRRLTWNKIRTVRLDPWERSMLLLYLEQNMVVQVQPDGSHLYLSPYNHEYCDKVTGAFHREYGMLWPWHDVATVNAYWAKLRDKACAAGLDAKRIERGYCVRVNDRIMQDNTYVWRGHMLRHVAATLFYYKHGMDLKAVQKWICHTKYDTTWQYIHSAEEMGTTPDYLRLSSYAEIFGYGVPNVSCEARVLTQMVLDSFGS